ncbi:ROK family protein [Phycisphaerales bacterium AB-hyl4]|uniref:ROK family protein n=1 Tax=Natronomicrosphaera hydrolytica TaxID=3242702 RepID=A0ABV4U5S5_9BACT
MATLPGPLESRLLRLLYCDGPLSRWELHEQVGVRPSTVSATVSALIDRGMLKQNESKPAYGRGRPPVPVEINDSGWGVLGLAIEPGRVSVGYLTPYGRVLGRTLSRKVSRSEAVVTDAKDLLERAMTDQVSAVGVSLPGLMDPVQHKLVLSAAAPGQLMVDLDPIYQAANGCPVILENDMHAIAAQRLLTGSSSAEEDSLLVSVRDGAIGAAMLVDGKPNRGCVTGGNELGHMRFDVKTDRCHCRREGCLACIFSTRFMRSRDEKDAAADSTLTDRLATFDGHDPTVAMILDYLAMALGNAINLIRPSRVILIGEMLQPRLAQSYLAQRVRREMLPGLVGRVHLDISSSPAPSPVEAAGWLALAATYYEEWRQNIYLPPEAQPAKRT